MQTLFLSVIGVRAYARNIHSAALIEHPFVGGVCIIPSNIVHGWSLSGMIVLLIPFLGFLANYLSSVLQSAVAIFTIPTCDAIHFYCFGGFF